jgi:hypothetical protein
VLQAKQALLEKLQALDTNDKASIQHADALQEEFKSLGFAGGPQGGAVNNSFFQTLGLIKEKHFLHKLAQAKARDFAEKDEKEQAKIKLRLLHDLLSRDERELQNFKDNLLNLSTGKTKVNKMMDAKLRLQEKKVKVKRLLQEELQARLQD